MEEDYFPKCFHCGYCCIAYDVIIINPEYKDIMSYGILINLECNDTNNKYFIHKKCDERCIYLNDNNLCEIHDKDYFILTPCYRHNLNKRYLTNCPIGEHLINDPDNLFNRKFNRKSI